MGTAKTRDAMVDRILEAIEEMTPGDHDAGCDVLFRACGHKLALRVQGVTAADAVAAAHRCAGTLTEAVRRAVGATQKGNPLTIANATEDKRNNYPARSFWGDVRRGPERNRD